MKGYKASCLPLLLIVAACTSGPPLRTFVLTPALAPAEIAPLPASPTARIFLRRVRVPDYLDTTDIVLREGSNEVKVSDTGHWGERLSQGMTHAVAADLEVRLPSDVVALEASGAAERQLLISVNALDIWPDGRCTLTATWTIVDHDTGHAAVSRGGTFGSAPSESVGAGDARLVDALSRTVAKLADTIAKDIGHISAPSTPNTD